MFEPLQRSEDQPSHTIIQPSLEIGKEDDEQEKEANSVADKVMRMSDTNASNIGRMHTGKPEVKMMSTGREIKKMTESRPLMQKIGRDEDEGKIQKMSDGEEEEKMVDADEGVQKMVDTPEFISKMSDGNGGALIASQKVEQGINNSKGSGQFLPANTRQDLGEKINADFSDVKIHTDEMAVQMNKEVGAKAFTHGNDIYFNNGQYNPTSNQGKHLLAHELTHTVQQSGNMKREIQRAESDTRIKSANLQDSKDDINAHVNKIISESKTQKDRLGYIYNKLAYNTSVGRSAIEDWVTDDLAESKKYTPEQSETKYSGVSYGIWMQPLFPILNPTMKVNGILIGSDKLGHFFQQGADYFKIAQTKGTAEAEKYGKDTEKGGFGLDTTGVYSNADLSANMKGMGFWTDIASNPNLVFDISSYIGKDWNESLNPNFYSEDVGSVVWKNLIQGAKTGFMSDLEHASPLLTKIIPSIQVSDETVSGSIIYAKPKSTSIGSMVVKIDIDSGATLEYFKTADTNAITGVKIVFTWTSSDGKKGTGTLKSLKEKWLYGMLFEKVNGETSGSHEIKIIL